MTTLLDFAVITIFARETLEGGIIIGEYRTVILRSNWHNSELTQQQALRAVTVAAIGAAALALLVIAAVAIPLAVLSRDFNDKTSDLIEGASKIVAAICILQLSLKMPQFFGLYYSKKQLQSIKNGESPEEADASNGMSLRSIRFNVAWNIWREVAECGVFLLPSFLTGDGIVAIPLSAVLGIIIGGLICVGIYYANKVMKSTVRLTIFTVGLLLLLSTGLFCGGTHEFEAVYGMTPVVWQIEGEFWSVDRLPMTIFKPFGYSDTRTVLEIVTFWVWLFFGLALHYIKFRRYRKPATADQINRKDSEDSSTPSTVSKAPGSSSTNDTRERLADSEAVDIESTRNEGSATSDETGEASPVDVEVTDIETGNVQVEGDR